MNPVIAVILGAVFGSFLTAVLFQFTSDPFTEAFGDRSWHFPLLTVLVVLSILFLYWGVGTEIPR